MSEELQPPQEEHVQKSEEEAVILSQYEQDLANAQSPQELRRSVMTQLMSEITPLFLRVQMLDKGFDYDKLKNMWRKPLANAKLFFDQFTGLLDQASFAGLEVMSKDADRDRNYAVLRDKTNLALAYSKLESVFSKLAITAVSLKGEDRVDDEDKETMQLAVAELKKIRDELPTIKSDLNIIFDRYLKFYDRPFEEEIQSYKSKDEGELIDMISQYDNEELLLEDFSQIFPEMTDQLKQYINKNRQLKSALAAELKKKSIKE